MALVVALFCLPVTRFALISIRKWSGALFELASIPSKVSSVIPTPVSPERKLSIKPFADMICSLLTKVLSISSRASDWVWSNSLSGAAFKTGLLEANGASLLIAGASLLMAGALMRVDMP